MNFKGGNCFLIFILFNLFFQIKTSADGIGDGSDGTQNISGIINVYSRVTNIQVNVCNAELTVDTVTGFSAGDLILIIQMNGAAIDSVNNSDYGGILSLNNAGNFEYGKISSIVGSTIQTSFPLANNYSFSNAVVQIVRVPQYASATVIAMLTCKPWNGNTGGILALDVTGTLNIQATIDVNGKGFRGGIKLNAVSNWTQVSDYTATLNPSKYAGKGEGIGGNGIGAFIYGRGAPANGGGGGNAVNAGGAGGGNGGCGGQGGWGYDEPVFPGDIYSSAGIGAANNLLNANTHRIFMGGGGGAGHENNNVGTSGSNGGAIVMLTCSTINGNANFIRANGLSPLIGGNDGAGGGGAGGSVLVYCTNFTTLLNFEIKGGNGGSNVPTSGYHHGPGGGGGGGLIWFENSSTPANVNYNLNGGVNGLCAGVVHGAAVGCDGTVFYNLNLSPVIISLAGQMHEIEVCGMQTVTLNLPLNFSNYSWSPSAGLNCDTCSSSDLNVSANTIFYGTYSSGVCGATDTFLISFTETAHLLSNDTIICSGNAVQLFSDSVEQYLWTPINSLSCYQCQNPIATPLTSTTYQVGLQSNNCLFYDSIAVTVDSNIALNIQNNDTTICEGNSIALTVIGASVYSWTPSVGLSSSTVFNPTVTPTASTTYYVTTTNSNCLIIPDSIVIAVSAIPIAFSGSDTIICLGDSVLLNASGGDFYFWSPSSGVGCESCQNVFAAPVVNTTYTVTVSNQYGCSSSAATVVTVSVVNLDAGINAAICMNESIQLHATGASTYLWTPSLDLNSSTSSNPIASPFSSITYSLTGVNADGCIAFDSVAVDVNALPAISVTGDTVICKGNQTQLIVTGADQFHWSPATALSSDNSSSVLASPDNSVTYSVTGTDANGCSNEKTITVTVISFPEVVLPPEVFMNCISSTQIEVLVLNADTFFWEPNEAIINADGLSVTVHPANSTVLTLVALNEECADSFSVSVIKETDGSVTLPTAFSPNNDGVNDVFHILTGNCPIDLSYFRIYNRWGQLVFQTSNQIEGWNGKYLDVPQEIGTYIYEAAGKYADGSFLMLKGNVTLLR